MRKHLRQRFYKALCTVFDYCLTQVLRNYLTQLSHSIISLNYLTQVLRKSYLKSHASLTQLSHASLTQLSYAIILRNYLTQLSHASLTQLSHSIISLNYLMQVLRNYLTQLSYAIISCKSYASLTQVLRNYFYIEYKVF